MSAPHDKRKELERIRRVSDQNCTAHATLRDRFKAWALVLDVSILALSVWGVALAFVDPVINAQLTPWQMSPVIWLGLIAVVTLLLSIVQLRVDWKSRAEAHHRTLLLFNDIKAAAGRILAEDGEISPDAFDRITTKYSAAGEFGLPIGERDFLAMKQRHLQKVTLSRLLDNRPFAVLPLTRWKLILRDNKPAEDKSDAEGGQSH